MLTKDELHQLYIVEMKGAPEIAKPLGVCPATIYNWLEKYGIPRRQRREAQMPVEPSKEALFDLYITQELSVDETARRLGSSESSVSKLLDAYGIPKRVGWQKCAGWNIGKPMSDEQRANLSRIAKQRTGKKSPRYGATLSDKTKGKIASSLKGRFRGQDNHQWRGGHKDKRHKWNSRYEYKEWRSAVFARDNYTCQMCGKKSNGDIQAHHIQTWYAAPDLRFEISNGITLCESCHKSIKGKESEHAAAFCAILQAIQ